MERHDKVKAERCELIFKMDYILLMFLTEKNLLEKFIDNCGKIETYYDFKTTNILNAFLWSDSDENNLWIEACIEYDKYKSKVERRINSILSIKDVRRINKDEW